MQQEREMEENNVFQEQVSPDEQGKFKENLGVWRKLPAEQREAIRARAEERIRAETDAAYAESGLNLNPDQREVFDLRYKQERRRLERELQEKVRAERGRRLPQIMDQLKREFGRGATPPPPGGPRPSVSPAAMLEPFPRPGVIVDRPFAPFPERPERGRFKQVRRHPRRRGPYAVALMRVD